MNSRQAGGQSGLSGRDQVGVGGIGRRGLRLATKADLGVGCVWGRQASRKQAPGFWPDDCERGHSWQMRTRGSRTSVGCCGLI